MFAKTFVPTLVVALGFGASALAQGGGSQDVEFFHQANSGATEVTPMISYGNRTTKAKGGTTDTKLTGFGNFRMGSGLNGTGVRGEYGLSDTMSVGAQLTYAMAEADTGAATKPKVSGLEDPVFYLRSTTPMGAGRLRWGGNFDLGFQKAKVESNGDMNAASGGLALTPYVGYDTDAGPGVAGGRLAYRYNFERTTEGAGGAETKTTGGDVLSLSAFYEYMLSDMPLGAAINYRMVGEEKDKTGGTESTDKSYSPLGISLYSRIPAGESAHVLAGLDFDFSAGGDAFDTYNAYALNVGYRLGF